MSQIKTFYDELGVGRDANVRDIKRAFKEIAKVYHPDKNPTEKQAWAHEQMSRFNFIVATLLNLETRKEYDELVQKYEAMPVSARQRRSRHEQNAIEREYAQVSVEILNLAGKSSNCRLKMTIGSVIGSVAALLHMSAYFSPFSEVFDDFPMTFAFSYFIALIGGMMMVFGISDYLGRRQYEQRIDKLRERRTFLRQRMFEAFVS